MANTHGELMRVCGKIVGALLLGVLLLVAGCAPRPPSRPSGGVEPGSTAYLEERVAFEVDRLREKHHLASVVVTVVDRNGPLYEGGFGLSNKEDGIAATPDTPYRMGSNSKLFVMLALLQLVERGRLDLSAPLSHYLPEFRLRPPAAHLPGASSWKLEDITLRTMLAHHSGIPNDYFGSLITDHPFSIREYPEKIAEMRAQHPVGLVHSYSNLAFALLGLVIERVSGQPFPEYVRRELFAPMKMDDASFVWTDALKQDAARSYDVDGTLMPRYYLTSVPAGSLIASPREMGKFATAMLNHGRVAGNTVVARELLEQSMSRQNAHVPLDFDREQGLAWFLNRRSVERLGPTVEHGGAVVGHRSAFLLSMERGLGVVVVSNSAQAAGPVQILAEKVLSLAYEVQDGRPVPEPEPDPAVSRGEMLASELKSWAGHYATVLGAVEVTYAHERLHAHAFGNHFLLEPLADGHLGLWEKKWGLLSLRPKQIRPVRIGKETAAGLDVLVAHHSWGRSYLGVRYEPVRVGDSWRARSGVYLPVLTRGDAEFLPGVAIAVSKEGYLLARIVQKVPGAPALPIALRPLDQDSAIGEGFGRSQGLELRFDQPNRLSLSGLIFEKAREQESNAPPARNSQKN